MPSTAVAKNITRTKSQISWVVSSMNEERRRAQRYRLAAPVALQNGSTGITRDISTEGIYFETERGHSIGDMVNLSVHLGEASIRCEGRVVRLEQVEDKFGIAVDLTSYRFD
jgi:hypothetical protein